MLLQALLLVLAPAHAAAAAAAGVVCTSPIPHTTQCYAGTGSLGGHKWSWVADCCAACANLTSATSTAAVPCAIWIKKRDRCLLLAATAKPRSGAGCISGTSLPPHPTPPPAPGPPAPAPSPAARDPLNPPLPPNRWGPYVGRKSELAPEYGFVSGLGLDCSWGMVEEIQGHFNFSVCQAQVDAALRQDKYVVLNPQTGAESPLHWLAQAGVPTVKVCFKLNQKDPEAKCTPELADHSYPYHSAKHFS